MLHLPFIAPYDWALALRMIGAHAVPGGEVTDSPGGTHRRLLLGQERPLLVELSAVESAVVVRIEAPGPPVSATESAEVETRVRHWLDLDADPAPLHRRFDVDPRLAPLIAARPGLRRIRYPESFEAVISTVLGQQVSLAAARTFAGRLVACYGDVGPG
ncbi:MAG: hypothetical protein L0H26_05980, partial [Microlunatus sp.]|nr:hypothetical protein [Microlunatus sp.]